MTEKDFKRASELRQEIDYFRQASDSLKDTIRGYKCPDDVKNRIAVVVCTAIEEKVDSLKDEFNKL